MHVNTSNDVVAYFKSSDNKASILLADDDTQAYLSAENGRLGFGTGNGVSTNNITILQSNNNVGIGTTSPKSKLDVDGGVKIGDDTDTASADKVGTMRYRTDTEYVEVDGEELVTNGSFDTDSDWTKQTPWTISGGVASCDGTQTAVKFIYQTGIGVVGKTYKCEFELTSYTSGSIKLSSNGIDGNDISSTGTHIEYLTFSGSGCFMTASTDFIGSIDNVSVIEVTEEDASYADMCMQTGASTYEWVNIIKNTY